MPVIIYKSNDYLNFIIGGLKPSVERIEIFTHDSFFYRCLRALFNGRTQYPKHFFSLYLSNKTIRTLKKVKEPAILLGEFIIGKTNRDEIQNQMRIKFARKLQKRNVTEKSHTSYSQKWLSNVN